MATAIRAIITDTIDLDKGTARVERDRSNRSGQDFRNTEVLSQQVPTPTSPFYYALLFGLKIKMYCKYNFFIVILYGFVVFIGFVDLNIIILCFK